LSSRSGNIRNINQFPIARDDVGGEAGTRGFEDPVVRLLIEDR